MSKVMKVPVSTWKTYNIFKPFNCKLDDDDDRAGQSNRPLLLLLSLTDY